MVITPKNRIKYLLQKELDRIKSKNPQYSSKAFADKLGISAGALSEILSGKRKLSKQKAMKIVGMLDVPDETIKLIEDSFHLQNSLEKLKDFQTDGYQEELPEEKHGAIYGDWKYYAILAYLKIHNRNDPKAIAKAFDLEVEEVQDKLQDLIDFGYLKKEQETLLAVPTLFHVYDNISIHDRERRIVDGLKGAKQAVLDDSVWDTSITSMLRCDVSKIEEGEKMLFEFGKRFSHFMSEGNPTEVFELNLLFFPRTKWNMPQKVRDDGKS